MMSTFYFPKSFTIPNLPPRFPIPVNSSSAPENLCEAAQVAETFTVVSRFWRIMHGAAALHGREHNILRSNRSLGYSEYKFREILAWADNLLITMIRGNQMASHVVVFHMWLHMAIMNILQPFVKPEGPYCHFTTFTTPTASPLQVYEASVAQLRLLVITYRMNYDMSACTLPWHMALTYLANGIIRGFGGNDASFHFRACLTGYRRLGACFPVTVPIAKSLVSAGLNHGFLSLHQARIYSDHLAIQNLESREISGRFIADLTTSVDSPDAATVAVLI
ncbi:hypothetical protein BGZ63DRAFT_153380 [Mariannaea sp. PMI_226]|nr:hypothetical protein BGZ63DRAFT_153380 [Mariannaea sp. PMI_226]